jgi:hypothetical protein
VDRTGHNGGKSLNFAKVLLRILGVICILGGLVWMGQGSGYFPYPASSFMIDQSIWIFWGFLMMVAGALMIVLSRRQ